MRLHDGADQTHIPAQPALDAPSDAVVIERSLRRPERFAAVFDRHHAAIHGYVARRLGAGLGRRRGLGDFLIAFDRRGRYDLGQPDAAPWLYGIASNLVARTAARRCAATWCWHAPATADAIDGHSESVDGRLDAQALRSRLAAALPTSSRRDREVLLLVAWAQLSLEEAARALGIPAGTARSRLHRARTQDPARQHERHR